VSGTSNPTRRALEVERWTLMGWSRVEKGGPTTWEQWAHQSVDILIAVDWRHGAPQVTVRTENTTAPEHAAILLRNYADRIQRFMSILAGEATP
jgi:hypothetical protein